jgi:HPt (histidine-containing phosphotransfer) domain-containing protein
MEPSATLNGRLLDLKQRFVQTMPDRIAAIATTLAGCADGGSEMTDRLERQFHTLAGTAGTYDLNAVAAAAFEGEEACAELGQSPLGGDSVTYLAFLVDQLRAALAADAPAQWTARTVLSAADAGHVASEKNGVSAA